MNDNKQKWEQICEIMKVSMKTHRYQIWLSELELMDVNEELKAIYVSANDPYKGACVNDYYGEKLDRAAEIIFGIGYRVYICFDRVRERKEYRLKSQGNDCVIVEDENGEKKHQVISMLVTVSDMTDEDLDGVVAGLQSWRNLVNECKANENANES